MAKMLTIDEMLTVLQSSPRFAQYKQQAEDLAQAMAFDISITHSVKAGTAEYWDSATMCSFKPLLAAQPIPEALQPYDTDADWLTGE